MATTTRVPATEITGIYGTLLETISRRISGQVPAGAGVMWHHPAVLEDSTAFGREVDSRNRLDPNLASFAAMAVEDGRITRMYAMRNPHELGRLDTVAELRR